MGRRGTRILLFAYRPEPVSMNDADNGVRDLDGLIPLGLVGITDELRPQAYETLTAFAEAGVDLKIISGDNPETVKALAVQAGFDPEAKLISGPELDRLDDGQLDAVAVEHGVFGRITPEQKEGLVEALHAQGRYVAMTGDGVNDVLSLKKADLGIAMQSGSQATRGVADIVLTNDSFAVLPHAITEGRRIIAGMQSVLKLFLTRTFFLALLIIAVVMVGTFPFSPRQSALLSLDGRDTGGGAGRVGAAGPSAAGRRAGTDRQLRGAGRSRRHAHRVAALHPLLRAGLPGRPWLGHRG
jgi:cation-transporting P-type ATPase E